MPRYKQYFKTEGEFKFRYICDRCNEIDSIYYDNNRYICTKCGHHCSYLSVKRQVLRKKITSWREYKYFWLIFPITTGTFHEYIYFDIKGEVSKISTERIEY